MLLVICREGEKKVKYLANIILLDLVLEFFVLYRKEGAGLGLGCLGRD